LQGFRKSYALVGLDSGRDSNPPSGYEMDRRGRARFYLAL